MEGFSHQTLNIYKASYITKFLTSNNIEILETTQNNNIKYHAVRYFFLGLGNKLPLRFYKEKQLF
jgi:hypothetical protein